eukprot:11183383-Lingulodinium_polyedra.AAC.1
MMYDDDDDDDDDGSSAPQVPAGAATVRARLTPRARRDLPTRPQGLRCGQPRPLWSATTGPFCTSGNIPAWLQQPPAGLTQLTRSNGDHVQGDD